MSAMGLGSFDKSCIPRQEGEGADLVLGLFPVVSAVHLCRGNSHFPMHRNNNKSSKKSK